MAPKTTVMFTDLTGSTAVFQTLGNEAATQSVTALTQWIAQVVQDYDGRVVKTLGDGVLALFPDPASAVQAGVQMQRDHARRQGGGGRSHGMQLRVGLDCGEIVEVDGDCYGEAVNMAARISELSGARQIWASEDVAGQVAAPPPGARFRALGPVPIRGAAQARNLVRIDWQEDSATNMMTLPAYEPGSGRQPRPAPAGVIELRFRDRAQDFATDELPVQLGRAPEAEFVVPDPRVSRLHARIEWRNNAFVLVDQSSYGTCVRFAGAPTEVRLRRDHCVLHGNGEIALGSDFGDAATATIRFALRLKG